MNGVQEVAGSHPAGPTSSIAGATVRRVTRRARAEGPPVKPENNPPAPGSTSLFHRLPGPTTLPQIPRLNRPGFIGDQLA